MNNQVTSYLTICKDIKRLEPLTLKAYKIDLAQFYNYLEEMGIPNISVENIDRDIINKYLVKISTSYTPKSLKRKIASLKAFFNYLEFEDRISVTPFRKIKISVKEPKHLPKSLSSFDIERIIRKLYDKKKNGDISSVRNIAVFEMLFATGSRVSELSNLRMSDFDLDTQVLSIRGKGNKDRLIYINNEDALNAIKNYYLLRNSSSEFIFVNRLGNRLSEQSIRYFIKKLGSTVLNKEVTPHMIRHSFATLMIEEGVDVTYVQSFLGHSSITTTQIYTLSTVRKQKQIMSTYHPRNRMRVSE